MKQRGSVLIAVIWVLSLLAVFTVYVNRQASQELLLGRWMKERVMLRTLSKAGVQRAMYEVARDEFLSFDGLNDTWAYNEDAFKDRPLGDGFFEVLCNERQSKIVPEQGESVDQAQYGACDESARININVASEEVLKSLALALQEEPNDKAATVIAQSIVDWRDEDDSQQAQGAESPFYKSRTFPYEARNGPFETVEELLMVRGIDAVTYDKLKDYVTVYTSGPVNFNTAPSVVLQALGLDADLAARVVGFRHGEDGLVGTEDDNVFQLIDGISPAISAGMTFSPEDFAQVANAISSELVEVKTDVFRINSVGRLIKNDKTLDYISTCVFNRQGEILHWQESVG